MDDPPTFPLPLIGDAPPDHVVTFTYRVEDIVAGFRLSSRPTWKTRAVVGALAFFGAFVGGYDGRFHRGWWLSGLIAGVLMFGLACLLLPLAMRWVAASRGRKAFAQQANLRGPSVCTWNRAGVIWQSPRWTGTMLWADYVGRREGRDCLLLYQSDLLSSVIPRRPFTDAQWQSLLNCTTGIKPK